MSDEFTIPAKFWKSISFEEFTNICMTSKLTGEPLRRLWRMREITSEPPESIDLVVAVDDLLRAFPPNEQSASRN